MTTEAWIGFAWRDTAAFAHACARAAHEANRSYCQARGDYSIAPWDETPKEIKESVLHGVKLALKDPSTTPEQSHQSWLSYKAAEGWAYGPTKDFDRKTHPCMVPFSELPPEHRAKDRLFLDVVFATARALETAGPGA